MRRVKTIIGQDPGATVSINIVVDTVTGNFTYEETMKLMDWFSGKLMEIMPQAPMTHFPLVRLKVE